MKIAHTPMKSAKERGATLIVTMVMMIILTLLVVSAIRTSNVNLKITGNFQWQRAMELVADAALEQLSSTSASFDNSAIQAGTATPNDICSNGAVVASGTCTLLNPKIGTVNVPLCTASRIAAGYTKRLGELTPMDNDWLLTSSATDSVTSAKVTVYRGITVRMLSNSCPE